METVKCAACGFLTVGAGEGELPIAGIPYRQGGEQSGLTPANQPPHCAILAQNIRDEFIKRIRVPGNDSNRPKIVLEVIGNDRKCLSFCQWRQGFTPKEHVEMKYQEELRKEIEERKKGDEQRANDRLKEDREWRATQDKETSRERFRQQVILQVITFVGGVLVTVILANVFGLTREGVPISK